MLPREIFCEHQSTGHLSFDIQMYAARMPPSWYIITFESVVMFHCCTATTGDIVYYDEKNIANDAAVIDLVVVQRGYCVVRYQGSVFRLALHFIGLVLVLVQF